MLLDRHCSAGDDELSGNESDGPPFSPAPFIPLPHPRPWHTPGNIIIIYILVIYIYYLTRLGQFEMQPFNFQSFFISLLQYPNTYCFHHWYGWTIGLRAKVWVPYLLVACLGALANFACKIFEFPLWNCNSVTIIQPHLNIMRSTYADIWLCRTCNGLPLVEGSSIYRVNPIDLQGSIKLINSGGWHCKLWVNRNHPNHQTQTGHPILLWKISVELENLFCD